MPEAIKRELADIATHAGPLQRLAQAISEKYIASVVWKNRHERDQQAYRVDDVRVKLAQIEIARCRGLGAPFGIHEREHASVQTRTDHFDWT